MRGLLPLTLLLALTATAGIALLATRAAIGPTPPGAPSPAAPSPPSAAEAPASARIRPYETTATLVEDLRDSLPGDDDLLSRECWRVSAALSGQARWTLLHLVPREASPRVRALLVFAAGVHIPDDPLLLDLLRDREPAVRAAAALATGHLAGGPSTAHLLGRVEVQIGRRMADETRERLVREHTREEDEGARGTIHAVLGAARG